MIRCEAHTKPHRDPQAASGERAGYGSTSSDDRRHFILEGLATAPITVVTSCTDVPAAAVAPHRATPAGGHCAKRVVNKGFPHEPTSQTNRSPAFLLSAQIAKTRTGLVRRQGRNFVDTSAGSRPEALLPGGAMQSRNLSGIGQPNLTSVTNLDNQAKDE